MILGKIESWEQNKSKLKERKGRRCIQMKDDDLTNEERKTEKKLMKNCLLTFSEKEFF
jgi:hypothetical protein